MYCYYIRKDCFLDCNQCYYNLQQRYYCPQFNYECPDCHGKFNTAAYVGDGTSAFTWRCPFCGRKLEGIK